MIIAVIMLLVIGAIIGYCVGEGNGYRLGFAGWKSLRDHIESLQSVNMYLAETIQELRDIVTEYEEEDTESDYWERMDQLDKNQESEDLEEDEVIEGFDTDLRFPNCGNPECDLCNPQDSEPSLSGQGPEERDQGSPDKTNYADTPSDSHTPRVFPYPFRTPPPLDYPYDLTPQTSGGTK